MFDLVTNLEYRYLQWKKKRKKQKTCDCSCDCCTEECLQPEEYDETPLLEQLQEKLKAMFE